jgi:hypothetical protein
MVVDGGEGGRGGGADLVVQAVVDDAVVNVVGGNLGRVEHGLGYFGAAKTGYVGFDLFYSRMY